MPHALALAGLDLRADADPSAIDLGDDVLPGPLLTRRERAGAPTLQVAGPGRQDLGPQRAGHAVDRLLGERRPLATEFLAGQLDRGRQGGQTAHFALQRRGRPLADAQGGQFGIGSGPLPAPPLGGACLGAAVEGGDPDDQAAQEAESQSPRLRGAS